MSTPENTFLKAVNKLVAPSVYHVKMNNPYTAGIPDCWYSGLGGDLWAEYKHIALPKRDATIISLVDGAKPALSALQQEWLSARHAEGREVCVIVGFGSAGVIFPGVDWRKPWTRSDYLAKAMPRRAIAAWIDHMVLT